MGIKMNLIEARILYENIRGMNPEGGLYIWATPDESTILMLQSLVTGAPFKAENTTEFHTTVLYHVGALPEGAVMPDDRPLQANITEIIVWPDRHETNTVVALLDSPELQEINANLLAQGFTSTFPDYRPHITLGTKVAANPALRLWVDNTNQALSAQEIPVRFDASLKGASNADA
jgi:hypothetical protein